MGCWPTLLAALLFRSADLVQVKNSPGCRCWRAADRIGSSSEHFCMLSTVQLSRLQFTWPFQALSDESRFRAVRLLASLGRPLTAGQLSGGLGCLPSHLSRHLNVLEATGLIEVRRRGRFHWINLRGGGAYESLAAAVLSMPDSDGILADDIARLLAMPSPGGESDPYSEAGAAGGAASAGGSESL